MVRFFALIICITTSVGGFGQDKSAATLASQDISIGPSLKDVEKWLKRELPINGSFSIVTVKDNDRTHPLTYKYVVESSTMTDCKLSLRRREEVGDFGSRVTDSYTVTLKDVDLNRMRVIEDYVSKGYINDRPSYLVPLIAAADRGKPFTTQRKQEGHPLGEGQAWNSMAIRSGDRKGADRAVFMLYRAAVLCGASSNSLNTDQLARVFGRYNRIEKPGDWMDLKQDQTFVISADGQTLDGTYAIKGGTITLSSSGIDSMQSLLIDNRILNLDGIVRFEKQPDPPKPAGDNVNSASQEPLTKTGEPTGSKMVNDDVVKLVKAGLSDQVIITSIRQAPNKDFDVTPKGLIALKDARVSDAVIVAMQEKGVSAQTPLVNETKPTPKYDATLAQPPKPPANNPCSGIESMGLYKNEVMSGAIGGGLVEWLAKIRNNTAVTKIVVFGWIDMYGAQKNAQVQIRGGDIATPRLDLTQVRAISPVRDLRILSCQ